MWRLLGAQLILGATLLLTACSSSALTSSSTTTGATDTASPTSSPLPEATLAIPVSFEDVCNLEPQVCSNNNGVFGPYGPFPPDFNRPLDLPSIRPGQSCPVSGSSKIETLGFGGVALGIGPVRPVVPLLPGQDPAQGIPLTSLPRGGWYSFKTLWFVDPSYQGPVRIRGARIDAPGFIAFGEAPDLGELIIPPGRTVNHTRDGYREAPGGTYVKTPGCYAWQVDGVGFSTVLVFRAVPVGAAASP
jgi:hypothetical protein